MSNDVVEEELDRGVQHLDKDPNDPRNLEPAVSDPTIDINQPG